MLSIFLRPTSTLTQQFVCRAAVVLACLVAGASVGSAQEASEGQAETPSAAAVATNDGTAGNGGAVVEPGADGAPDGEAPAEQRGFNFTSMIPLYLGLFLLWYLIVLRPQSSQKSRRAELLAGIKKNTKVVTVGGIVGTVTNVSEATGEVTIKSNDTPLRVQRESIRDVIEPEDETT